VLQIDDQFVTASPDQLTSAGRLLVDASAVVVVSLHRRAVTAAATLPSRRADAHFRVSATYDCQVTDAALMLQFGCWDVRHRLGRLLTDDSAVRALAAAADPVDGAEPFRRIRAHAVARARISPPYVPGMACALTDLVVAAGPGPAEPEADPNDPHRGPGELTAPAPQDYVWDG
jgi:hypothetical protein